MIAVTWGVAEEQGIKSLKLIWAEQDGPQVKSIAKNGFGSVVLNRVATQALSGTGELKYGSNDVVWTLEAPMSFVEASLFDDSAENHQTEPIPLPPPPESALKGRSWDRGAKRHTG